MDDSQLQVQSKKLSTAEVSVIFPRNLTADNGSVPAVITVKDKEGTQRSVSFKLLGPQN